MVVVPPSKANSKVIFEDDNLALKLEYVDCLGIFLVHCYVDKWSPSIRKLELHNWSVVRQVLKALGVTEVYTPGMNAKFAKLFGFSFTGTILQYDNGTQQELMKWETQ